MERNRTQGDLWSEAPGAPAEEPRSRSSLLKEHWNAIWRLFFVQSSRNERTMDGLGFFAILQPFMKRWAASREGGREIARRHLGYFNAGLYLSSTVAGVAVNMEARRSRGEPVSPQQIERVKTALSSVLAARANYFFDGLLTPLGLTIAGIFAIYDSYVGPVVFLAMYNIFHFQSRIGGYCRGVELGEGVSSSYVSRLFREERLVAGGAAFASGVFTALLFVKTWGAGEGGLVIWGAVAAAASAALGRKISHVRRVAVLAFATALYLVVYQYGIAKLR